MKLELEQLKELVESPRVDSKGKNIVGICPYCGAKEWGISIIHENHPWQCYRKSKCGESGTIYKLLKLRGRLDEFRFGGERKSSSLDKKITSNVKRRSSEVIQAEELPEEVLPIGFRRLTSHPYTDGRGFTKLEYEKYTIGQSKIDPRYGEDYIILGIEQHHKIVGYLGRHLKSKSELDLINEKRKSRGLPSVLRYNNSRSCDFSKMLMGYDEVTENTHTIILVEGAFDKIRVDQLLELDKEEGVKCLCCFSVNLSDDQKLLLHTIPQLESLIVMYDSDVISQVKYILQEIEFDFPSIHVGYHPEKDPGDMDILDIIHVLDNLETIQEFLKSKVNLKPLKKNILDHPTRLKPTVLKSRLRGV